MSDTRRKLLDGTIATLRDRGIAGTSARVIAASAAVNQALIFYHFGSVGDLIDAACREAAADQVQSYRPRFRAAVSLGELLTLGQELHETQRSAGNVTVLAQVLAGARHDPQLAATAKHALTLWITEIESTLDRLMRDSPVAEVADIQGLARAIAAAFIGLELYEGVDPAGARGAFAALQHLSVLTEILDDLPPAGRRALRGRIRRTSPGPAQPK